MTEKSQEPPFSVYNRKNITNHEVTKILIVEYTPPAIAPDPIPLAYGLMIGVKEKRSDRSQLVKEYPMEGKVEGASEKALAVIRDIFRQTAMSQNISDEEKIDFFEKGKSLMLDFFRAHENKPIKGFKRIPDLSKIPLWKGRKQDGMPLEFLEKHYGNWLLAFRSKQDLIFQDQVRTHDPKLLQGLYNQFQEEGHGRKVLSFLKPQVARTRQEAQYFEPCLLKQAERIKGLLRRQKAHTR